MAQELSEYLAIEKHQGNKINFLFSFDYDTELSYEENLAIFGKDQKEAIEKYIISINK